MNTDSYKVLKLSNGEMVVCELNGHDDKMYDIMNPLKMDVVPIQSRSGIGETLNLTPWLQHFTDQKYFNFIFGDGHNRSECFHAYVNDYFEYGIDYFGDDDFYQPEDFVENKIDVYWDEADGREE